MAGWLSDWLRSVVTVILLAVIVDMLLPNKAMQRYARVAVGLVILLTILNPVMQFFRMDFANTLDAATVIFDEKIAQKQYTMPSLEHIQQKAEQLKQKQQQEAMNLTKQTLEKAIAEHLTEHIDEQVGQVVLTLKAPSKEEVPQTIEKLHVQLILLTKDHKQNEVEDKPVIAEVTAVEDIAQVQIELDSITNKRDASEGLIMDDERIVSNPQLEQHVKNIISSRWEVSKKLISVQLVIQSD